MEQPHRRIGRRPVLLGIGATALLAGVRPARAAETLRFGKSLADLFPYTPVDVGIAKGLFAARGVAVEIVAFQGAAKMQQAMVAGAIDLSIGSGSSMINVLKGVPSICIAETTAAPVEVGIVVAYDSPMRSAEDLKGKKIGVATVGSVTEWMAFELARVKGWGPKGVVTVAVGGNQGNIGALRSKLVDAVVIDIGVGLELEQKKEARLLLPCSDYVRDFIMHVIYGSKQITEEKPDAVRGFLAGWFEAVAFMRENRAAAIDIVSPVTGLTRPVMEKEYDLVMPAMSPDGRFDRKGLAAIARSFVDLGMSDKEPDMALLYTEAFLPKR
jgi:ABC-type nitrate/sulfonate/bicarbonate transport system substrate-binding protein